MKCDTPVHECDIDYKRKYDGLGQIGDVLCKRDCFVPCYKCGTDLANEEHTETVTEYGYKRYSCRYDCGSISMTLDKDKIENAIETRISELDEFFTLERKKEHERVISFNSHGYSMRNGLPATENFVESAFCESRQAFVMQVIRASFEILKTELSKQK
jgi:hypothetical protein